MKKLSITLLLICGFSCLSLADERTDHEMIKAAMQVLNAKGEQRKAGINAEPTILRRSEQLSIVGYKDGRWTFIANDDNIEAVLGYTDSAVTGSLPPALEWWIEAMNVSLAEQLASGETFTTVRPVLDYSAEVAPLITTKWDQSAPYYDLCPEFSVNNIKKHCLTGCLATAMAQVMNYHEYPIKGTGSRSFYVYDDKGTRTRVYANYGNTTYDWANMLDVYGKSGTYSVEQGKAVATLMYHCGVAVEMQYGIEESGALCNDAGTALRKYFNYHENVMTHYRDIIHKAEWMNMIFRELSDGCPIIYGGASSQGGHAFVLDGYNADGKVHVNWGWSGSGDGYFDVAKLNGYSQVQEMVIVRKPDDTRYTDKCYSLWGILEGLTAKLVINNVTLTARMFANFKNHTNFNGYIGVMAMDTVTHEVKALGRNAEKFSDIQYGAGTTQYTASASISGLADGVYRIYLASKDDSDPDWQPVKSKEGVCNSYILTLNNGASALKPEDNSKWMYDIITGIDDVYYGNSSKAVGIYNLNGMRMPSMKSGLNLIRQSDGSVMKILVK